MLVIYTRIVNSASTEPASVTTLCCPIPVQATNLDSNGSSPRESKEPKENRVRSMASQLLAKFESKQSHTFRRTQVISKQGQ